MKKITKNKILSLLVLFLATTIQFNIPVQAVNNNLKVHYIDVGQADSINVIHINNYCKNILKLF